MTTSACAFNQRIVEHYSQLSAKARLVADYLQHHPDKVLIQSTAEIASACHVSKASVSRFFRQLGYQDHQQVCDELRQEREWGQPLLTSEPSDTSEHSDLAAISQVFKQLEQMDCEALVQQIGQAKRVTIIGYRNSYPLAMHFRQQLMQCRKQVHLLPIPGQSIGEELVQFDDKDLVILIGIRRRPKIFAALIDQLEHLNCLLITDQSGQCYRSKVKHLLVCPMSNHSPLDSYAAPMSLLAHLSNKVYDYLAHSAHTHSHQISNNYQLLDELEPHN
ncbi:MULTISPECIES: MurR/RpiR family transcriptional regulator [unclassified Agarivorans]|uniref:MurR/RpiR family transcriptional regulator n=1 Tax=unclassified Agarivorans TaxID=2636026 RepID=UPI0026E187D5|nr:MULTISPECIES: MurR/RpiR family transcriptional regulator [unclassified Agarivorans]MDO6687223.1 MurR/RpiR family transcriptional regulator [Agarivorans sp. 3_MG-2023]MDO6716850.1 MurR/RpiR family transcriptional regulator [Agarivorans sp. 2_MG-2023]